VPALKNQQHEDYCRYRVAGIDYLDAFEKAGFKRHTSHASRLEHRPDVQARIAEMKAPALKNAQITREWILESLRENAIQAMTPGKTYAPAAANKALEMLGKEMAEKMFVDRVEVGGKNGGPIQTEDMSALTPVERAQRLAAILTAAKPIGN